MAIERTLILIKPDAVGRGLIGEVMGRFERGGLKIIGLKLMRMDGELVVRHYDKLVREKFFKNLKTFMTSGPLVAMAVEGLHAISLCRKLCGVTNCLEAAPGTIRGDFGLSKCMNLVHASDESENAGKELSLFFTDGELFEYERPDQASMFSDDDIA